MFDGGGGGTTLSVNRKHLAPLEINTRLLRYVVLRSIWHIGSCVLSDTTRASAISNTAISWSRSGGLLSGSSLLGRTFRRHDEDRDGGLEDVGEWWSR